MPETLLQPEERQIPHLKNLPPLLNIPGKVRIVKDCLRVGSWYLGDGPDDQPLYWHVDEDLLHTLAENFNSQFEAGHYHPLQWGHPRAQLGNSEQTVIEYIRNLWVEDGTLYFAAYVTPETAQMLMEKHRQVSVRVVDSWKTQAGEEWGPTLIHIAIVDHGAVPAQMGFKELSAKSTGRTLAVSNQRDFKKLAAPDDNTVPEQILPKKSGNKTMDFAALVDLINQMLSLISPNAQLPTEGEHAVTEETIVRDLGLILATLGQEPEEDTETEEEQPTEVIDEEVIDVPEVPEETELSAFIKAEFSKLNARLDRIENEKTSKAKDAYVSRCKELGAAGLKADLVTHLIKIGDKVGYDLSSLTPYESLPGLKFGSKVGRLATPSEPPVGLSKDKLAKAKKLLGVPEKK